MSLVGSFFTMPLPDLLQWLATAGKTGTLQIKRGRATKWIQMRDGRLVGCSSDDPPQRLGQYLLSREKITEQQLREGLATQEQTGQLGMIFVEMGVISPDDLSSHLDAKAEETIYSIFDWNDATFRYDEGLQELKNVFPVDLQVQDVLLRGLKRYDEMGQVRQLFHDPGLVLGYSSTPPGPEIFSNKMARTMYSAIDGERTLAEILLQVRGSEYLVYKFLYELHRKGYVEIVGSRAVVPKADPAVATGPESTASRSRSTSATAVAIDAAVEATTLTQAPQRPETLEERRGQAQQLISAGKPEEAMDALEELCRENPQDDSLRHLAERAERDFIERAYRHIVPADKIPVLLRPIESLSATKALTPHDYFLLSRIDGTWDIKSIIQVAPLREVEALRTLKRMREEGVIELRDPAV